MELGERGQCVVGEDTKPRLECVESVQGAPPVIGLLLCAENVVIKQEVKEEEWHDTGLC